MLKFNIWYFKIFYLIDSFFYRLKEDDERNKGKLDDYVFLYFYVIFIFMIVLVFVVFGVMLLILRKEIKKRIGDIIF